ncbi:MAG TPA: hypothetical protein PLM79_12640, partial [Syntrophobacteraceae bacterium]|nr:hypothetical protein [Syntrophobacteraceae bacterium]
MTPEGLPGINQGLMVAKPQVGKRRPAENQRLIRQMSTPGLKKGNGNGKAPTCLTPIEQEGRTSRVHV